MSNNSQLSGNFPQIMSYSSFSHQYWSNNLTGRLKSGGRKGKSFLIRGVKSVKIGECLVTHPLFVICKADPFSWPKTLVKPRLRPLSQTQFGDLKT